MLKEKNNKEIVEYFKEVIQKDMAEFHLTNIYYRAKEKMEIDEKVQKLIDITKIKSFLIEREVIIDENNAIFEYKLNDGEICAILVVDGSRSMYGYKNLEQGLLGWICEKQGCPMAAQYIFKMLDMETNIEE